MLLETPFRMATPARPSPHWRRPKPFNRRFNRYLSRLLDASGNLLLDSSGNIQLFDPAGSTSGCCGCQAPFVCGCTHEDGSFAFNFSSATAIVSGITACPDSALYNSSFGTADLSGSVTVFNNINCSNHGFAIGELVSFNDGSGFPIAHNAGWIIFNLQASNNGFQFDVFLGNTDGFPIASSLALFSSGTVRCPDFSGTPKSVTLPNLKTACLEVGSGMRPVALGTGGSVTIVLT